MIPMRVSATAIESFRLWCVPDQEWMTEAMLQDTILRRGAASPAMLLGKAFGAVIESPERYRAAGGYRCDGYWFSDDMMSAGLALYDRRGLFEVKGTRLYDDVLVVAKADQLLGGQLVETKTTKSFDFEKYANSVQWRLMADIFEPLMISYRVFQVQADDKSRHPDGGIVVEVGEPHTFNLFPYAALRSDCERIVSEFRSYVVLAGLADQLRAFQAQAEAA